jgi:molybdenum cofactor synthesis domain-containing protein
MWTNKRFSYTSLNEAYQLIRRALDNIKPETEEIPIFQAYSRVLAEDIISEINIPPADISHFDGYAIKSEDTAHINKAPLTLKVIGRSFLDSEYRGEIHSGEAVYVSTGCALPKGADAVIPIESVLEKGDIIEIRRRVGKYENVTPMGSDFKKGEVVLKRGQILRAQDIKLLADMKRWHVKVFRKPKVAILSIGNELTNKIEETDVKKFNSHGLTLSILVEEAGGTPLDMGVFPDDKLSIINALKRGLERADIIATVGGASVGYKDLTWETVKEFGSEVVLRGIKVQPGRVTSVALANHRPIVMLPGHIQSMLVGFYFVLLPIINYMQGLPLSHTSITVRAIVSQDIPVREFKSFKRVRFVKLIERDEERIAEPLLGDSSLLSIVTKADGFIIVEEGKEMVKKGEVVNVYLVKGLSRLFAIKQGV